VIRAVVDPSVLTPPGRGPITSWLEELRQWSRALDEIDPDLVRTLMSVEAQGTLHGAIGGLDGLREALTRSGSPLGAPDVMRLIESIRARSVAPSEELQPQDVAFSTLSLDPNYVPQEKDFAPPFEHDLGHLAAFAEETDRNVSAITAPDAWSGESEYVHVQGRVEAWERFGSIEEPKEDESDLSIRIPIWITTKSVEDALRSDWSMLLDYPRLAIILAYREVVPSDDRRRWPLDFTIGPVFTESMLAMGYLGKKGRIKATFHAAAYVGCQRAGQLRSLKPHPYLRSGGGAGQPVKRPGGSRLMRGSLSTGPNANRLMWWDGPVPEILGVVGHDDNPADLT
jgi:hypothetical protein